jgi:hypothetical protein
MTRHHKLMLDILADISLLLSFTPNAWMLRIGSLSAWIVKTGECSPSPNLRYCRNNRGKEGVT